MNLDNILAFAFVGCILAVDGKGLVEREDGVDYGLERCKITSCDDVVLEETPLYFSEKSDRGYESWVVDGLKGRAGGVCLPDGTPPLLVEFHDVWIGNKWGHLRKSIESFINFEDLSLCPNFDPCLLQEKYLGGYAGGARKAFPTMTNAMDECLKVEDCKGLTYERKPAEWTLRKQTTPKESPSDEISILRSCYEEAGCTNVESDAICNEHKESGKCQLGEFGSYNDDWVKGKCARTCGFCDACQDLTNECVRQAHNCDRSPYVREDCPKTCGICEDTGLMKWTDGQ